MQRIATITVIGRDRTGLIAKTTNFLFEQKANIESLEEHVTRGQFSMIVRASWRNGDMDRSSLETGLRKLASDLGLEIRLHITDPKRRQRMAIMVSHEPHCLETLVSAQNSGRLAVTPALILSNHRDLEPIAVRHGLQFFHVPWNDRPEAERQALRLLEAYDIDFIVLARFMKILSPNFVWRYQHKIINIHPSLLPSFPGAQAYRQAWERGVRIAGVTAHFVTMHLDDGPIIAQGSFKVRSHMRLAEILKAGRKLECQILLRAVRIFLTQHDPTKPVMITSLHP